LGHRGARLAAPENTLEAFELALAHGCDGFEFDVRCTRDRRLVLCHDPKLLHRELERCSYAELCELRGGAVPCLEDVIARFGGRCFLDIELKIAAMAGDVAQLVRGLAPESFVISSFLPAVLLELNEISPALPLGYICSAKKLMAQWKKLPISVVIPHSRLASKRLINDIHAAGKKCFVWTVNRRQRMHKLAELGVEGIISDDTELLGDIFRARR
jgi:glycerophosphoryl diester phosphodiesterase